MHAQVPGLDHLGRAPERALTALGQAKAQYIQVDLDLYMPGWGEEGMPPTALVSPPAPRSTAVLSLLITCAAEGSCEA